MPITSTPTGKAIVLISIAFFLVSLACPCYDTEKADGTVWQGAGLLIMGTTWFICPSPGFVWLANPLLLTAWMLARKNRDQSFILSMLSLFIALCFLFYKDILTDESGSNTTPITAHRVGYWVWVASISVMLLGNLFLQMSSRPAQKPSPKFI